MANTLNWGLDGIYTAKGDASGLIYIVRFLEGMSKQCIRTSGDPHYSPSSTFYKEWGTYEPADNISELWLNSSIIAEKLTEKPKETVRVVENMYPIFN